MHVSADTKFCEKSIFSWHVQKNKNSLTKRFILAPIFVFYMANIKNRFIMERLQKHVITFLFGIS
jgi:hypothetical protein